MWVYILCIYVINCTIWSLNSIELENVSGNRLKTCSAYLLYNIYTFIIYMLHYSVYLCWIFHNYQPLVVSFVFPLSNLTSFSALSCLESNLALANVFCSVFVGACILTTHTHIHTHIIYNCYIYIHMYMYSLFIRIDFFAIQREESWKNAAARWKWAAVTKLPMAEQTHTRTHTHIHMYICICIGIVCI